MLKLPSGELHIWSAKQSATLPRNFEASLSPEEQARAARFHLARHRFAYVFAHGILRDVLSRYLNCLPGEIRFGENAFGKPFLDGSQGEALEFNLSHAVDLVLVALCRDRHIGVDVEKIRQMEDLLSIAAANFTPNECAFILGQPPSQRERAFLRCWTRKEACIKGVGQGLSISLQSFDTLISGGEIAAFVKLAANSTDETTWQVASFDVQQGYVAAVAVEDGMTNLIHFEWSTE
jgi:4'-phosphopantetheinyl transferase